MGAKSEGLAKQLEAKVREVVATLEKLGDSDWMKVTEAEQWPVGVTAHHLAGSLEPISEMVKAVVLGRSPDFSSEMIDEMNSKHAKDFANCLKKETVELLKRGATAAAAVIRGLSDDQLVKSGLVLKDAPAMNAEQLIAAALLNHIDGHLGSIRKTVGITV